MSDIPDALPRRGHRGPTDAPPGEGGSGRGESTSISPTSGEVRRRRRNSVTLTLPENVKEGDQFRTAGPDGFEFTFTIPAGVAGGQRVQVEVPKRQKKTIIKLLVPDGAVPGDMIKGRTPKGTKFKIPVPKGKGPGDTIRAIVPEDDDGDEPYYGKYGGQEVVIIPMGHTPGDIVWDKSDEVEFQYRIPEEALPNTQWYVSPIDKHGNDVSDRAPREKTGTTPQGGVGVEPLTAAQQASRSKRRSSIEMMGELMSGLAGIAGNSDGLDKSKLEPTQDRATELHRQLHQARRRSLQYEGGGGMGMGALMVPSSVLDAPLLLAAYADKEDEVNKMPLAARARRSSLEPGNLPSNALDMRGLPVSPHNAAAGGGEGGGTSPVRPSRARRNSVELLAASFEKAAQMHAQGAGK